MPIAHAPELDVPAPRRQRAQFADADEHATVGYWRLRQPRFVASDDEATGSETDDDDNDNDDGSSDADSEYEVLMPSRAGTDRILAASPFYEKFMPARGDRASELLLAVCGSAPVRLAPLVAAALVRRFTTDLRFNWATQPLRSFLEVAVWAGVTLATASIYRDDWLFALEVGTFAGALMSVCDDVAMELVRALARVVRNQRGGRELLARLGFDVPANGKAPTDGRELALLQTLVFGYLGVLAMRALWAGVRDVPAFALLAAAAGAAFVVSAEFFCLWLPTRRVGLTLQTRFTQPARHWREHPRRSALELAGWAAATLFFFARSGDLAAALQLGTLAAVALCLSSGLDELPDVESADADACAFWEDRARGDALLRLAGAIVSVQDAVARRLRWSRA